MKQRQLGANGPMVSAIGLGCLSFGGLFGPTTKAESLICLDAALDHGISFYDTANIYGAGVSESVLGEWLALRKPKITLATKAGIVPGSTRRIDNSASYLRAELEASLRRLGRDYVDLFYIHRHDQAIPIEDVADSLGRLIDQGLIGGYGMSEVSPGTLRRAHAVRPCRAVQNEYSLWTRQPELGLVQACAELGVALVPFAPLARGALGEPMLDPDRQPLDPFRSQIPRFDAQNWPLNRAKLLQFRALAAQMGHSAPALAIAWVLHQGDHLIPIPGTRSADHLTAWAKASEIRLSASDRSAIEAVLPVGWACGDRYSADQASTVERFC